MAYGFTAQLTVPAPTGSHTDFTLCLIGTDLKMATVANGGAVVNTVTRVGQTVPADLILSSDAAGTSLYSWGWDFYSAVTGQVIMWVKIPSYTAGMTIYVSVGNAAVVAYQGGAQGSEFDANVAAAYHLANGTTLSVLDFSANAANGTNSGATASASGKINGAAAFSGSTQYITLGAGLNLGTVHTISFWLNYGNGADAMPIGGPVFAGGRLDYAPYIDGPGAGNSIYYRASFAAPSSFVSVVHGGLSGLTQIDIVRNGTAISFYKNGSQIGTTQTLSANNAFTLKYLGGDVDENALWLNGVLDEVVPATTNRSANWVTTSYANKSSPPAIGAFTANVSYAPVSMPMMGCQ